MRAATRTLAALVALVVPSSAAAHEPWVTEFNDGVLAGDPWDVAKGPDGNIWFVNRSPAVIGKITPEGVITEYTDGLTSLSEPSAITAGPDGNKWFTQTAS